MKIKYKRKSASSSPKPSTIKISVGIKVNKCRYKSEQMSLRWRKRDKRITKPYKCLHT